MTKKRYFTLLIVFLFLSGFFGALFHNVVKAPGIPKAILYEYYNVGNDDKADIYGAIYVCQTFTVGNVGTNENHFISGVNLLLNRKNNPGTFYVNIYALDGTGKPIGASLTSGTIDSNTFQLTPNWEWIDLTPYWISASTSYGIVCHIIGGSSSTNVQWSDDLTSPTYSGGSLIYSTDSGGTWTVYTQYEMMFEEWGYVPSVVSVTNVTIISPLDNATNICPCCIVFGVNVTNSLGEEMDMNFGSNYSWTTPQDFQQINNVTNGTYYFICDFPITFNRFNFTYDWWLIVVAETSTRNFGFKHFTTAQGPANCTSVIYPAIYPSSVNITLDPSQFGAFLLLLLALVMLAVGLPSEKPSGGFATLTGGFSMMGFAIMFFQYIAVIGGIFCVISVYFILTGINKAFHKKDTETGSENDSVTLVKHRARPSNKR